MKLCRIIHRSVVCGSFWGLNKFKMAAIAVTKVQNGRQIQKSSDLGEIWFPSRLWCCELIFIVGFAMAAILNSKWPPKYTNPSIWAKFVFKVDYDVANWYSTLVCYGGHFESKMATKIQKSSNLGKIWLPSRFFFLWIDIRHSFWNWESLMILQIISFLVIIIIFFIIIILLLLRMNLSDQIIRDWWSDLY